MCRFICVALLYPHLHRGGSAGGGGVEGGEGGVHEEAEVGGEEGGAGAICTLSITTHLLYIVLAVGVTVFSKVLDNHCISTSKLHGTQIEINGRQASSHC